MYVGILVLLYIVYRVKNLKIQAPLDTLKQPPTYPTTYVPAQQPIIIQYPPLPTQQSISPSTEQPQQPTIPLAVGNNIYEYINIGISSFDRDIESFNELGKSGWELVAVVHNSAILKRIKQ